LSVTGFDGIELSRYAVPALTTVDQEELDTGAVAWRLLSRQLEGLEEPEGLEGLEGSTRSGSLEDAVLMPRLVIGDSTGRVPPSRAPVPGTARTDVDHSPATLAKKPLGWAQEGQDWTLLHGGTLLGAAVTGASMPPVHSPRPHLHHVGASLALPDVNGTTYWGGRTFVEGRGSTLLSNHGVQEVVDSAVSGNGRELRSRVRWHAHDERDLLLEQRSQSAFLLPQQ